MPLTIHIPRRFDPLRSGLGMWLCRRARDPLRAEAVYLLVVTVLALGLIVVSYAAWLLWGASQSAAVGQALLWLACVLFCGVGFRPQIEITAGSGVLEIRQGRDRLLVLTGEIEEISFISGVRYHRHYRRYAGTRAFVNRIPAELLLLRVPEGHIVLGLSPAGAAPLIRCLDPRGEHAHAPAHAA